MQEIQINQSPTKLQVHGKACMSPIDQMRWPVPVLQLLNVTPMLLYELIVTNVNNIHPLPVSLWPFPRSRFR